MPPYAALAAALVCVATTRAAGAAERAEASEAWKARKSPGAAMALGLLCPGCGHFYLRDAESGGAFLGATVALTVGGFALMLGGDDPPRLGDSTDPSLDAKDPIGLQLVMAGQNLWFYGAFSAYRDARLLRGDRGARVPLSRETAGDLASAPFRPSVILRPWVWAGAPLLVGAALGFVYLVDRDSFGDPDRRLTGGRDVNFLGRRMGTAPGFAAGEAYYAALFVPVAVGEEALFRGAVQPAFSQSMGPWSGWAAASLVFGAVHLVNFVNPEQQDFETAAYAVPFITATGSYLGLASMKTGGQLATSVAIHFWYDFLLGTASFLADPD
ncbi:MAG: CPBP family intramembrane glutamic endopeptidase, partial [Myxococcota bacterium]